MELLDKFIKEWENSYPHILAHTSGSTGCPKEIKLLKSDMISSARATNSFFGITSESLLLLPLSIDYIAGKMMVVRALCAGCKLEVQKPSNYVEINKTVDLLAVVPTQLEGLLATAGARDKVANLLIGGAPLDPAIEARVASAGFNAWLGYGMTETCSHVALRRVGADPTFQAMEGISFSVDRESCLVIHSDRFSWGKLATRDVVDLKDSRHFIWQGRADNVINSGGLKLHPEILEKKYRELIPDLAPFYLTGEKDGHLGERLLMVVEMPSDRNLSDEKKKYIKRLMDQLRSAITDHKMLPKRIMTVDELPRTSNGKLKRNFLD